MITVNNPQFSYLLNPLSDVCTFCSASSVVSVFLNGLFGWLSKLALLSSPKGCTALLRVYHTIFCELHPTSTVCELPLTSIVCELPSTSIVCELPSTHIAYELPSTSIGKLLEKDRTIAAHKEGVQQTAIEPGVDNPRTRIFSPGAVYGDFAELAVGAERE